MKTKRKRTPQLSEPVPVQPAPDITITSPSLERTRLLQTIADALLVLAKAAAADGPTVNINGPLTCDSFTVGGGNIGSGQTVTIGAAEPA